MKCYCRTLHRLEGGNWIVGKNRQVISSSRFFITYFWIYSFTILFHFFQTLFSTHNGSTSNPCCYWIFPPSNLLFSSLLSLPSSFTTCMLFLPGFSCGAKNHAPLLELASRRERWDLFKSDFKWSHWGFWGIAPGNWAKLGGWIEFSLLLKLWA